MPSGRMGKMPMPRPMDVRMEHTRGRGRQAEVWVADELFTVCDGISSAESLTPAGPMEGVRFRYMTESPVALSSTVKENPRLRKGLDHLRSWAYTGYGQVVSIMPVMIDFGLLTMEDPNWATDESLIGRHVRVAIDRLEIEPGDEEPSP